MKKFYLTVIVALTAVASTFAQSCVIDTTNNQFIAPAPNAFPCIEKAIAFSGSIQLSVPATAAGATLDSIVVTNITKFPVGISYACNPVTCAFPGGSKACINFYGTTNDTVGTYTLAFDGYAKTSLGTFTFSQLAAFGFAPSYQLYVINHGDSCRAPVHTGISNFSSDLNAAMVVYPNPSNGQFEFKLDAGKRVTGEIVVMDVNGRMVFTQQLDAIGMFATTIDLRNYAKGIYTLQLRTSEGFASRNISIE